MLRRSFLLLCLAFLAPLRAQESPIDMNDFRGRVVYLDFWASWCAPCRQSFPWMQTIKDTYERDGLAVVAVNLDPERADADHFLQRLHPTFDVRFDPKGKLAALYNIKGMPASVLIDRRGAVRFTHSGFRPADGKIYESQLRELLAENQKTTKERP